MFLPHFEVLCDLLLNGQTHDCEDQRNLKVLIKDENKRQYATMTHDESTKNHPGGVSDIGRFEKEGRLYQTTDDPSDGFNALQFYISKNVKPSSSTQSGSGLLLTEFGTKTDRLAYKGWTR